MPESRIVYIEPAHDGDGLNTDFWRQIDEDPLAVVVVDDPHTNEVQIFSCLELAQQAAEGLARVIYTLRIDDPGWSHRATGHIAEPRNLLQ